MLTASLRFAEPSYTNRDKFRDYNNSYKKICRASRYKYYREKFEGAASNIRETWTVVREVMGNAKSYGTYPSYFNYKGAKLR